MNEPQALYISGPMRNVPGFNHAQFAEVKAALRVRFPHAKIYNPAENFDGRTDLEYHVYMTVDLGQVLMSDAIVLLPNWADSEGAVEEARVGLATGKTFYAAANFGSTWRTWPIDAESVRAGVHSFDPELAAERRSEAAASAQSVADNLTSAGPDVWIDEAIWAGTRDTVDTGTMRTFATGATRDTADGKLNYEGFLSPLVIEAFAEYMHGKRLQPDGTMRSGDNWQKGIDLDSYMDSMWRHFMDVWKAHRGYPIKVTHLEALMALAFNVMGYAHELMVAQARDFDDDEPLTEWERELLASDPMGVNKPEAPESVSDFNAQVTRLAETIREACGGNPFANLGLPPAFRYPGRDA